MPKGDKKRKSKGDARRNQRDQKESDDNESVFNDNVSVVSSASDFSTRDRDDFGIEPGSDVVEEVTQEDLVEEKLIGAIEAAGQKSAKTRLNAIESIGVAFTKHLVGDFVCNHRLTILDVVEKVLKKGTKAEIKASCKLAVLLAIQLGVGDDSEHVYKELKPTLTQTMLDKTVSNDCRASALMALSNLCFIASNDLVEVGQLMDHLQGIFTKSYSSADSNKNAEEFELYVAALSSWSLLLTLLPISKAFSFVKTYINKLVKLLDEPDVNLRICAGETIALLYEYALEYEEEYETFELDDIDELLLKLKNLATDSNKFRAKKDRKQQRSIFRDVLHLIDDNEFPHDSVKIGSEILELDSWLKKTQYENLCKVLGTGMNLHLKENELLRDIFEMGSPILEDAKNAKLSKADRQFNNSQAFKFRTQSRAKNRDKRSATFETVLE